MGGNIFDPLNLNSLLDEEVSRALNAETPKSSPLPAKGRDPVEILIPKDITDPLSLNTCTDEAQVVLASPLKTGRKRHRHRGQHHQQQAAGGNDSHSALPTAPLTPSLHGEGATQQQRHRGQNRDAPQPYELNTAINCRDEVVSPLPSALQGPSGSLSAPPAASVTSAPSSSSSRHRKRRRTSSKSEAGARGGGQGPKEKGRGSGGGRHHLHPLPAAGFKKQQRKFQYGNYCKYYGYRNPSCEDGRLRVLKPEWFRGRDILDLGCNVGHLTLSIACKWGPSRMVGLDIDARLIHSARQNIRHYLSEELRLPPQASEGDPEAENEEGTTTVRKRSCFPASLTASRGPIAAPQVPLDGADTSVFPNNVVFVTVRGSKGSWDGARSENEMKQECIRQGYDPEGFQCMHSSLRKPGPQEKDRDVQLIVLSVFPSYHLERWGTTWDFFFMTTSPKLGSDSFCPAPSLGGAADH